MHVASDIRVGPGFISAPIVGRGGVRQSQRDRSSRQQNCFSRWKHLIAPLAISDARQLKNENNSRCAVREFLYDPRKSEFGDSLVKVLFWKEQSSKKFGHSAFSVSIFFMSCSIAK
jgi:hypothetical protein